VKLGTTAAQKKLFFNLRKLKAKLRHVEEGDLPPEKVKHISKQLNVTEDEVVQMNRRLAAPDHSLNAPLRQDGDMEWQDWLVDERPNPEEVTAEAEQTKVRRQLLEEAMKSLTKRERHILAERRLRDEPLTLEDLSQQFGISRERVRQIEVRAFEKLQKAIKQRVVEQHIDAS
jgi:RNA polymerase sigma-32 factor